MADQNLDEAVLAIQEAANKISSASTQMGCYDGKQDELLASMKILTERVANMENATRPAPNKRHSVSLYDRVSLWCGR